MNTEKNNHKKRKKLEEIWNRYVNFQAIYFPKAS